jgi:hypothetical protein
MQKKVNYNLITCIVISMLLGAYSFYNTLSYASSIKELSKIANYLDMWSYTFFVENKTFLLICPMIIIYIGCLDFHKIYHSGFIKNVLQRQGYNEFLKKSTLKAWSKSFFFYSLISTEILFLCMLTFKKVEFSPYYLIPFGNVHPICIYIVSFILSAIFSITITNIGLLVTRYCEKFSLTVIISYLIFIGYAIFSEIILGYIISQLISIEGINNAFSIFNMVILDGNVIAIIIYCFFLYLITTLLVRFVYRNKSEVLLSGDQKN